MSAIFGERLIFGQQNGSMLELRVFGDEFYARYETIDGYSVVYDLDLGQYCYAELENGQFNSTRCPVSKPVPMGLKKNLKEQFHIRNSKFNHRYTILREKEQAFGASSNVMRTFSPNSGLLDGRQLSIGNIRGLTILVQFPDLTTDITQQDVEVMLNSADYTQNGNYCSVFKYYDLMSSSKLQYTNLVVGPVTLSRKQSYYINQLMVAEALSMAVEQYNLDLAQFDSQGQGVIDALSVMYAGRSLYTGNLWPHNSVIDLSIKNHRTHFYTIQSLGRSKIDLSIGTFAHETGHMLCRFPDLYDYGQRDGDFEKSSGLGQYCLMSSGNHLNGGKTPSPICAYLRDLAGWCDREVFLNQPGAYDVKQGDYRTALRFRTDKKYEYFLVENRFQTGLDQYLPSSGLALYHCDTRGSNEYQDGTPDRHYQCALIQADGRFDLEKTTRGGDKGDLFTGKPGVAISDTTSPNAKTWDGSDSGLIMSDIGQISPEMTFNMGPVVDENRIVQKKIADLIIPDNVPQGIESAITITQPGLVKQIQIKVDISHTYQADLVIKLQTPSGKQVELFGKQPGTMNNLTLSLDSNSYDPLSQICGDPIQGGWKLMVADLVAGDSGRLNFWEMTLIFDSAQQTILGQSKPSLAIPDNDTNGIRDTITITQDGRVSGIAVMVDIYHTFSGDLQIEIESPSGRKALLKANDGKGGQNVKELFSDTSTPALKSLFQEPAKGDWILAIRDLALHDTGRLNQWSLEIKI